MRHTFQGFQDLRKRLKEKHGKKLSSVDGQFPSSHKPSLLTNQNSMQVVEERCAKLQTWLNGVSVLGSIGGDKVFLDWLEAPEDARSAPALRAVGGDAVPAGSVYRASLDGPPSRQAGAGTTFGQGGGGGFRPKAAAEEGVPPQPRAPGIRPLSGLPSQHVPAPKLVAAADSTLQLAQGGADLVWLLRRVSDEIAGRQAVGPSEAEALGQVIGLLNGLKSKRPGVPTSPSSAPAGTARLSLGAVGAVTPTRTPTRVAATRAAFEDRVDDALDPACTSVALISALIGEIDAAGFR